MTRKNLLLGFVLLFATILVLMLSDRTKAEQLESLTYQQESVVEYLKSKLDQLGVPVDNIVVLQDVPLEIEVTIRSLGTDDKGAPEDSINVHMVFRESMFAADRGYRINGLTTIVLNMKGEQVYKGWIKIEPELMYHKIDPPRLAEAATASLLSEKLAQYGLSRIDGAVISAEGFQTLNLYASGISKEDAALVIPPSKDGLHHLTQDLNSQGAGIALAILKLSNETDEPLLVYFFDLQFGTEGWWVVDGINIDSWYPSIPAPAPSP